MYGPSESLYVAKVIGRKCEVGTYDGNFWTYLVDWEWENLLAQWVDGTKITDTNSQRRQHFLLGRVKEQEWE
eukprot:10814318-Ditylum_brightwellii.AAC.1